VHEQVARVLYRLGLRSQALSSYRALVRLAPPRLPETLVELDARGYGSTDLATLAGGGAFQAMTVAKYLVPKKAQAEVTALLAQAGENGVPAVDRLLVKADLAMALGRPDAARSALEEARRTARPDGRVLLALANLEEQEGHLDLALEQVRLAAISSPFDAEFARRRLRLILRLKQWSDLDDALEGLKNALRQHGENITEVHLIAGQTHEMRGNLARALSEFRMATTLDANSADAWSGIGRVSEAGGDLDGAIDGYRRLSTVRPNDSSVRQTIQRLEHERTRERVRTLLP
jgi:tetratricopeptide (TPR) repeat protein